MKFKEWKKKEKHTLSSNWNCLSLGTPLINNASSGLIGTGGRTSLWTRGEGSTAKLLIISLSSTELAISLIVNLEISGSSTEGSSEEAGDSNPVFSGAGRSGFMSP